MEMRQLRFETKAEAPGIECRDLPLVSCELKFAADKDALHFSGYASKWDGTDSWGDTMQRGAFARALKERTPLMLFGHDRKMVIGKYLQVKEDAVGLHVAGELTPGHSIAADVGASLKHGALTGLSVGGYTVRSDPKPNGGRAISEYDLYEISPVAMPADDGARIDTATVKAMIDQCEKPGDFENVLREAGFSRSDATGFVARMRRALQGEPASGDAAELACLRELSALVAQTRIPKSLLQG